MQRHCVRRLLALRQQLVGPLGRARVRHSRARTRAAHTPPRTRARPLPEGPTGRYGRIRLGTNEVGFEESVAFPVVSVPAVCNDTRACAPHPARTRTRACTRTRARTGARTAASSTLSASAAAARAATSGAASGAVGARMFARRCRRYAATRCDVCLAVCKNGRVTAQCGCACAAGYGPTAAVLVPSYRRTCALPAAIRHRHFRFGATKARLS